VPARRATPGRNDDKRNIAEHYDLSNDFFALMLDETMTYSCAVFERPGATLAEAQEAKIDRLCSKLELAPTDHLVEIGSGWGGLAVHAATNYGCRVTTTTISDAQRTFVEGRVADAGLADRITVVELDWRDLQGRFDKLVSVEMVEAVDWRWHDQFLAKCAHLLTPDGLAAIQAIVIDDRSFERAKRHRDFVRRMVFPGGCLPSVASLTASLARATDLRIVDLEDIGHHYPETLRRWADTLASHADAVTALGVGQEFRRLWDLYLAYCEASFLERHISDVQLVLAKSGRAGRSAVRPG
jgi:cyclopropane-fatty-acyl-phospholipid synthase